MDTVVLDIDGTLLDSNYHHALAWARAFDQHGIDVPLWRVHRCIGMGGDRLVVDEHRPGTPTRRPAARTRRSRSPTPSSSSRHWQRSAETRP